MTLTVVIIVPTKSHELQERMAKQCKQTETDQMSQYSDACHGNNITCIGPQTEYTQRKLNGWGLFCSIKYHVNQNCTSAHLELPLEWLPEPFHVTSCTALSTCTATVPLPELLPPLLLEISLLLPWLPLPLLSKLFSLCSWKAKMLTRARQSQWAGKASTQNNAHCITATHVAPK